jgi:hypothetical protein
MVRVVVAAKVRREAIERDPVSFLSVALRLLDLPDHSVIHFGPNLLVADRTRRNGDIRKTRGWIATQTACLKAP